MSATAFARLELELGRQIREASLDHEAFQLPLKVCELTRCRATCCHDGVFLIAEEQSAIDALLKDKASVLDDYGWNHPDWVEHRHGRAKSRTIEAREGELADDFPAHFLRTRCVFLDQEHRCVLQRLAMDEGRHPWWWKPISCWLHPLLIRKDPSGRPVLTLARPGKDPVAQDGYPGFGSFTPCGVPQADGIPAWRALRSELELLGRLGGRDLVSELS